MTDTTTTPDNLLDNDIPAKFKDPQTGAVRVNDLARSYSELERKFSTQPRPPKSADEYCVNCDHGLFTADAELNRRFHEKGFTQEQVQFVYDIAAEKMVPMVMDIAADFQAERELERLVEHFGGPDKWRTISHQLLAFGQRKLPRDVLDTLASSYDGVLALHRMMLGGDDAARVPVSDGLRDGAGNRDTLDLQSMMRDPRYWRDQDPSFIARVTDGFKKLYGEK